MWVTREYKEKTPTHEEIEDTQPQHVEGKTDVAMKVKPIQHSNTQTVRDKQYYHNSTLALLQLTRRKQIF